VSLLWREAALRTHAADRASLTLHKFPLSAGGVNGTTEASYSTLIGQMMADVVLQNDGDCVIETKLESQARYFDVIAKLFLCLRQT